MVCGPLNLCLDLKDVLAGEGHNAVAWLHAAVPSSQVLLLYLQLPKPAGQANSLLLMVSYENWASMLDLVKPQMTVPHIRPVGDLGHSGFD